MRSRFVDFPGQYVLHCHILIHEDRGMMQLIEVVPDKTLYSHH
jgi:FtsP/CotA-like multicopper oxidase with cupredoxin domain